MGTIQRCVSATLGWGNLRPFFVLKKSQISLTLLWGHAGVGNGGQGKERSLKASTNSNEPTGSTLTVTIESLCVHHPSRTSWFPESSSLRPASSHQPLGCRGEAAWLTLRQPEASDKEPTVFLRSQPHRPWPGHAGRGLALARRED